METSTSGVDKADSQNLRDFLRVKQEHENNVQQTSDDPSFARQQSRTLLEIIRDDPQTGHGNGKKGWKTFKNKLKLRRTPSGPGSAWTSSQPMPTSDIPINRNSNSNSNNTTSNSTNRMMMRRESTRYPTSMASGSDGPDIPAIPEPTRSFQVTPSFQRTVSRAPTMQRNASRAIERASGRFEHTSSLALMRKNETTSEQPHFDDEYEDEHDEDEENEASADNGNAGGEGEGEGEQPVRMSLLDLLAETDSQMGLNGYEDDEEDDEEDGGGGGGEMYSSCCVCMVRHKGAAFIPCGHTFCRLCSRELWVQRGNCPLCNNYILEILDIF